MSPSGSPPGILETMRAMDGRVRWLDRHMERLARSAIALGLDVAEPDEIRDMVEASLVGSPSGPRRVRVTATAGGSVRVDVEALDPPPPPTATAVLGAWDPRDRLREHKTTRRAAYRRAAEIAAERGAGHALLLDAGGRLGETATANVLCVLDGRIVTPPVEGILPGIARGVLIDRLEVEVAHLSEPEWRGADEIAAVSALRGAMPITSIDGRPVGDGTTALAERVASALEP